MIVAKVLKRAIRKHSYMELIEVKRNIAEIYQLFFRSLCIGLRAHFQQYNGLLLPLKGHTGEKSGVWTVHSANSCKETCSYTVLSFLAVDYFAMEAQFGRDSEIAFYVLFVFRKAIME